MFGLWAVHWAYCLFDALFVPYVCSGFFGLWRLHWVTETVRRKDLFVFERTGSCVFCLETGDGWTSGTVWFVFSDRREMNSGGTS